MRRAALMAALARVEAVALSDDTFLVPPALPWVVSAAPGRMREAVRLLNSLPLEVREKMHKTPCALRTLADSCGPPSGARRLARQVLGAQMLAATIAATVTHIGWVATELPTSVLPATRHATGGRRIVGSGSAGRIAYSVLWRWMATSCGTTAVASRSRSSWPAGQALLRQHGSTGACA